MIFTLDTGTKQIPITYDIGPVAPNSLLSSTKYIVVASDMLYIPDISTIGVIGIHVKVSVMDHLDVLKIKNISLLGDNADMGRWLAEIWLTFKDVKSCQRYAAIQKLLT